MALIRMALKDVQDAKRLGVFEAFVALKIAEVHMRAGGWVLGASEVAKPAAAAVDALLGAWDRAPDSRPPNLDHVAVEVELPKPGKASEARWSQGPVCV